MTKKTTKKASAKKTRRAWTAAERAAFAEKMKAAREAAAATKKPRTKKKPSAKKNAPMTMERASLILCGLMPSTLEEQDEAEGIIFGTESTSPIAKRTRAFLATYGTGPFREMPRAKKNAPAAPFRIGQIVTVNHTGASGKARDALGGLSGPITEIGRDGDFLVELPRGSYWFTAQRLEANDNPPSASDIRALARMQAARATKNPPSKVAPAKRVQSISIYLDNKAVVHVNVFTRSYREHAWTFQGNENMSWSAALREVKRELDAKGLHYAQAIDRQGNWTPIQRGWSYPRIQA